MRVSKRRAKKMLKANLRKTRARPRIKILRTVGNTYVIPPNGPKGKPHNIACVRAWSYCVVASNHPKLQEILAKAHRV